MATTDCILKVFHTGKLAGKYAVYFKSKKSKDVYDSLNLIVEGALYVTAGKNDENTLAKVRAFLTRRELTYEEIILN